MVNPLEEGRRILGEKLSEQEEIHASCKEIFTTAIEILETQGKPEKKFPFLKYQVVLFPLNSSDSPVVGIIYAGANLKKAREITMKIKGVGGLRVRKGGPKGKEEYKAQMFAIGMEYIGWFRINVYAARGYLNAIRQVKGKMEVH